MLAILIYLNHYEIFWQCENYSEWKAKKCIWNLLLRKVIFENIKSPPPIKHKIVYIFNFSIPICFILWHVPFVDMDYFVVGGMTEVSPWWEGILRERWVYISQQDQKPFSTPHLTMRNTCVFVDYVVVMVVMGCMGVCICAYSHWDWETSSIKPNMMDKKELPITNCKAWGKFILQVSFFFFIKCRHEE